MVTLIDTPKRMPRGMHTKVSREATKSRVLEWPFKWPFKLLKGHLKGH